MPQSCSRVTFLDPTRRIIYPTRPSGCSNDLSRPDRPTQINQHLLAIRMWNNYQSNIYHRVWESWTDLRKTKKIVTLPDPRVHRPRSWSTLKCPAMGNSDGCLIDRVSLESDPWPFDVPDPTDYFQIKVWRTQTGTLDIWHMTARPYECRCA